MLVSVIIPTHNRGHLIQRSILSVLSQSFSDLEVIVVDDGSDDDTREVVEQIVQLDSRVRYLVHHLNKGAQAARNTGIRAAAGEWVAFLDSDDYWKTDSLLTRLETAEKNQAQVVFSDCEIIQENQPIKQMGIQPLTEKVYRKLLIQPGPMFQSLLVTKAALQRIRLLDEQIIAFQEWDTFIRLARHFEFGFVPQPTFVYDCRGADTISKNKLRDAKGYEQVVIKHRTEILFSVGPQALSKHFQSLTKRYGLAGAENDAKRCERLSHIWWPRLFHRLVQGTKWLMASIKERINRD